MSKHRLLFGFIPLHDWGPWVFGTFGHGIVRVKACRDCGKVRGDGLYRPETGWEALRAAGWEVS
jgi:hypothetical protein